MFDPSTRQHSHSLGPTTLLAILVGTVGTATAATAQSVEPPTPQPISAVEMMPEKGMSEKAIAQSIAPMAQPSPPELIAIAPVRFPETPNNPQIAQQSIDADAQQQLQQRLQQLEERQQQLEQEIQFLRQELERSSQSNANDTNDAENTIENATDNTTETTAEAPAPEDPQTFSVSAEALILEPSTSNLQDYAIVGEDSSEAFVISGDVASVDYGTSLGLRFTGQYGLPNSPVDLSIRYSTFAADGSDSVTRDPDGILLATLANPSQNESALTASANTELNYSVTDFELGYTLNADRDLWFRLFGGITVANIQQDLRVRYDGDDFDRSLVSVSRDFDGYGLRLGGQANLDLGSNFSLFGRASGTLLMGNFDANQRETNENGQSLIVELDRDSDDRLVPMIELAAGLQWEAALSDRAHLSLATGYELQNWFNLVDSARLTDNAGQGVLSQDTGDLNVSGFFIRAGMQFEF